MWCSTVGSIGISFSCFYSVTKTPSIVHFKRQISNYLFPDWLTHSSALKFFTKHRKKVLLTIAKMSPLTYSSGGSGGGGGQASCLNLQDETCAVSRLLFLPSHSVSSISTNKSIKKFFKQHCINSDLSALWAG